MLWHPCNRKRKEEIEMRKQPTLWLRALLLALAVGLAFVPMASAQTTGASLGGKVVDASGSPLPGVTITATEKSTGFARSAVSGSDGGFRLLALPVGDYGVTAELNGFATVTVESVKLSVASQRELRVEMRQASVEETITVTTDAPLVETTPAIGTVVSQNELESLPLNGRQFANLAVLAPGTALAYNSDPTKPGQLTVALNGGIGRNVNFTVDGGDNTDDTIGGALQNFNLESVQEFRIQTMQYKAEYGRSSGGVLSVVTKTGSNEFRASAWEYYRDDSLNSKTESEKLAGLDKGPYSRDQYGAAVGGPIVRDKAHFFGTYEKTKRDTQYVQNVGVVGLPGDGTAVTLPFQDELGTAKITWDISAEQYLQVRYGYQKNADKYGASSLSTPDSLGTVANEYKSYLLGHTWQAGANALNEALFQYTKFDNLITADSSNPYLYFPSGGHTGQNINTPQSTHQVKYQYRDDFSFTQDIAGRRNDFKAGGQYIHEPTLGGDFSTGLSGQFSFADDSVNSPITDISFFGGFFGDDTPVDQYSIYAQDDLYFNDRLTLNVGVRYDKWTGFDLDQHANPIWRTLSAQTRYNEPYLNDFKNGGGGKLSEDDNNVAPRIGFTYDLKGNGSLLLRGGYGTYYDFPYTNATILFPASAVQSNYGVVYNVNNPAGIRNPDGSLYRIGQPLPPNGLPGADIPPPNEVASPTLATPYSDQASLGVSWQVNNWLGLNAEAVSIYYHDIPFRFRANPRDPATGARRFPAFGNFRIWYGNGRATYDGVNVGARIRRSNFELQGFYTYSKTDGNVLAGADEFRITDVGHQPSLRQQRDASVNPLDPLCGACFGPLDTDSKHKITFGGTWNAPLGINLSGMYRYRSALPYTLHSSADLNGDGLRMDLSPGVSHVNSKRGDSFSQFDVRVSRDFVFGDFGFELLAEMFNVFNDKNATGFAPDFANGGPNATNLTPSAYAGDPLQGEQQLIQLGLRLHWR
jgi:outer membrane receptor protein involved in Fe transport